MSDSTVDPLTGPVVSTDWLGRNLGRAGLKILDGSWHMPALKRDIRADFAACHIPGARLCDVDEVAAPDTAPLPHMAPDEATFAAKIGALGIGDGDTVVVYDSAGIATAAARVWWLFRLFGFDRVAVLDGGLPKWLAEGRPTESGEAAPVQPAAFTARKRPELIRSADQVLANIDARADQVTDARAQPRFEGAVAEPWPGRRSGICVSIRRSHRSPRSMSSRRLVSTMPGHRAFTLMPAGPSSLAIAAVRAWTAALEAE